MKMGCEKRRFCRKWVMRALVVLVPGFSHLSLGAILEPLRVLGDLAPEVGISVELGAIGDTAVPSSSGEIVLARSDFGECLLKLSARSRPDVLFFCAGLKTPYKAQKDIQKLLRTAHRAGVTIFGTGCAAWKFADAGILQEGAGTVHWTTLPAFAERHRNITAKDALFVTSEQATSTPGDAATLDMVVRFIEARFSEEKARYVCAHLMMNYPRAGDAPQPRDAALRDAPEKLRRMIDVMGANLETPLPVREVAALAGVSLRQAQRLFAEHLGATPKRHYLRLRLDHSRLLIEQTAMSILEVSIASGFSSRRKFTRDYVEAFGFPPTATRRTP